jgi:hypothetical protein
MKTEHLKTYLALHEAKRYINKAMIALLDTGLIEDKTIKETYFILREREDVVDAAFKNVEAQRYQ